MPIITPQQAQYYAQLLTSRSVGDRLESLSQSLLSAAVDINPHQVEVCQMVACAERRAAGVAFDQPDLSEEIASSCKNQSKCKQAYQTNAFTHSHDNAITLHLYAIVEAVNTACIPTLSPDEKKADKSHRNINRRVSPSVFIGTITVGSAN